MKAMIKSNIKFGVVFGLSALVLVGCGGSSEEEQMTWLNEWNSSGNYKAKLKVLRVCFENVGIRSMTQEMSDSQNEAVNECELDYITDLAEKDDISLDRELLANNIIQL
jgi:hypothetical protein